ncbi:hypothetical protein DYB25_006411 [Aphanomyces astaci]|uniref:Uncharacterized protein n=1 Tax=Aphanomyces astaci TaxID=112090 RepID=A0A397BND9_APHAT|nr:hypothetical protein DYB25_006411 [Aphanomyces astaci]
MSFDAPFLRQSLLDAAVEGDLDAVVHTLDEGGASIANLIDSVDAATGLTALHHSCMRGFVEIVCYLVRHGAAVGICDHFRKTPLHHACHFGFTEEGETALHLAAQYDQVEAAKLLVSCGANIQHATIATGDTPLHYACRTGAIQVAVFLVSLGQSVHDLNKAYLDSKASVKAMQVQVVRQRKLEEMEVRFRIVSFRIVSIRIIRHRQSERI